MKRTLNKFTSGNPRQPDYHIHSISMEVMRQKHRLFPHERGGTIHFHMQL